MMVNRTNPEALGVKRTPTIVVLFEGQKVPKPVYFEGVRYPCTLYRRQVNVCSACGELGHRADVCPNGEGQKKCRGCGMSSPLEDHQCDPKCSICGGAHQTADRKCRHRFRVPYIVRQRRRRRRQQALEAQEATGPRGSGAAGGEDATTGRRASSQRQSASTGRYGAREWSGSRVRSRSRGALRQQSTLPLPGGAHSPEFESRRRLLTRTRPSRTLRLLKRQAGGQAKRKALSPPPVIEIEADQMEESPETAPSGYSTSIEESLKQIREALRI
ncbi:hypothetical protein MTO96_018972 [Rhipicephalus appendiculatus]